jgi:transcriptional regulator with XRE-family HTH domain
MKYAFAPQYFRTMRIAAGLSQAELANAAGVHVRTVCAYEQGLRAAPDICTLAALADVMGVSLRVFLRTVDVPATR